MPEPEYHNESEGTFAALFKGDSLELLASFPDETIDMVFADPPYFLSSGGITCKSGKMESVDKGEWDRPEEYQDIVDFNERWLGEVKRILKPNGTIWVSGTSHNIYIIGNAMQKLGYRILNDVVWEKPNPPPNLSCRYLTHSTEILLWASRDKDSKHTFNYEWAKRENKDKQMKNVWRIKAPQPKEKRFGKHPTQKPEQLLERIINISTEKGALILDPFVGSGTTMVCGIRYGRSVIGIDNDEGFLANAIKRVENEAIQSRLF